MVFVDLVEALRADPSVGEPSMEELDPFSRWEACPRGERLLARQEADVLLGQLLLLLDRLFLGSAASR